MYNCYYITTSSIGALRTFMLVTRLWPIDSPRAVLIGAESTDTPCFFQTREPPCTRKILTKGQATPTAPRKLLTLAIVPHFENPWVLADAFAFNRILRLAGWWWKMFCTLTKVP